VAAVQEQGQKMRAKNLSRFGVCISHAILSNAIQKESEADFDRLVADPLLKSIANACSKNRDAGSALGNVQVISDLDSAADRQKLVNYTLLVGGEYRPLGPVSECINVDEIEQVQTAFSTIKRPLVKHRHPLNPPSATASAVGSIRAREVSSQPLPSRFGCVGVYESVSCHHVWCLRNLVVALDFQRNQIIALYGCMKEEQV
jgi:hypothetical protein